MMTTDDKILNGARAKALLEDELLNAVFDAVAEKYRMAWENSPRGDIANQQAAHYSLASLKDVIGAIRVHLTSSQIYQADLDARRETPNKQFA